LLTFALVYITDVTDLPRPGIYFTLFSLAGIGANLAAGTLSDRWGRVNVLWPNYLFLGAGIALLFYLPYVPAVFLISCIAAGTGNSGSMAAGTAWLIDIAEEKTRATALSIQESTIDLSIGLGSFFFGLISSGIGLDISFVLVGLSVIGFGLYFRARHI